MDTLTFFIEKDGQHNEKTLRKSQITTQRLAMIFKVSIILYII